MDVISGLAAASQALEIAKVLRSVGRDYDAVALKGEIIDLMDKLLDIKGALQDAREQIEDRDRTIAQLRASAVTRDATIVRGGLRYQPSDVTEGEPQGLPYCRTCEEVDGRMVSTVSNPNKRGSLCPRCKTENIGAEKFAWDDQRF